jgi:hypothetical protein
MPASLSSRPSAAILVFYNISWLVHVVHVVQNGLPAIRYMGRQLSRDFQFTFTRRVCLTFTVPQNLSFWIGECSYIIKFICSEAELRNRFAPIEYHVSKLLRQCLPLKSFQPERISDPAHEHGSEKQ